MTAAHPGTLLKEIREKADLVDTQPVSISGNVTVLGPLTDAQIRATALPVSVASLPLPSGASTEATLLLIRSNTKRLKIIDHPDTAFLNCGSTTIPKSSGGFLQIVATLVDDCKKIIWGDDIGKFIGLYTGAAASEALYVIIPKGGIEIEVNIPAGTRISLRNMEDVNITNGKAAISFLGEV